MSWVRYNAIYTPALPPRTASAALSEAQDGCAAASTVALHENGAWIETRDGVAVAAAVAVHLASVAGEGRDDCAASAHAGTHAGGSFAEANDNAALAARVALAGSAGLHEGNDRSSGSAHIAAPAIVDPNFLISARPRLRRMAPDARIRAFRAAPRVRTVIPARRA